MGYFVQRGLGAVSSGSIADTVREALRPQVEQINREIGRQIALVNREISKQVDRGVDNALDRGGDAASAYLDSAKGKKLGKKLETRIETAVTNVARKNRWNLVLAGTSFAALTVVGVAFGSRVGKRGIQAAAAVALLTALPLLLAKAEDK